MERNFSSARLMTTTNLKPYISKTVTFISLIVLIAISNNYTLIKNRTQCIYDFGVELLQPITESFLKNKSLQNTLIISSSLNRNFNYCLYTWGDVAEFELALIAGLVALAGGLTSGLSTVF